MTEIDTCAVSKFYLTCVVKLLQSVQSAQSADKILEGNS